MNFGETPFSQLHHGKVVRVKRNLAYCIAYDLTDLMMHGCMEAWYILCSVAWTQGNTFLCIVLPQDSIYGSSSPPNFNIILIPSKFPCSPIKIATPYRKRWGGRLLHFEKNMYMQNILNIGKYISMCPKGAHLVILSFSGLSAVRYKVPTNAQIQWLFENPKWNHRLPTLRIQELEASLRIMPRDRIRMAE